MKRVDGRTLGEFFADEIARPLGADFHIGTPPECDPRAARVIAHEPGGSEDDDDPTSIAFRVDNNPVLHPEFSWRKEFRRAEDPGGGAYGNARSVALCHTPAACGGTANGATLLSGVGVARMVEVQYEGPDVIGTSAHKYGMGFAVFPGRERYPRECGWGGWGGSLAVINLDAQMSFGYVMNRMIVGDADTRRLNLLFAAYDALAL